MGVSQGSQVPAMVMAFAYHLYMLIGMEEQQFSAGAGH